MPSFIGIGIEQRALIQLRGEPFHLRPVGGRLLRDNDVAAVRQHSAKSVQHSVGAADNRRCRMLHKSGSASRSVRSRPERNRFPRWCSLLGQNKIGPDDARQVVANFFAARKLDQLRRFPGIEITRDPRGLLAFDALLVELIAGALKNEEPMAELFEFRFEFWLDRKRSGESSQSFSAKRPSVGKALRIVASLSS